MARTKGDPKGRKRQLMTEDELKCFVRSFVYERRVRRARGTDRTTGVAATPQPPPGPPPTHLLKGSATDPDAPSPHKVFKYFGWWDRKWEETLKEDGGEEEEPGANEYLDTETEKEDGGEEEEPGANEYLDMETEWEKEKAEWEKEVVILRKAKAEWEKASKMERLYEEHLRVLRARARAAACGGWRLVPPTN